MGTVLDGVVVDNDLFLEYHNFQKGSNYDKKKIKRLFHFYKKEIVSNVQQYEDTGVNLDSNLKAQMVHNGLKRQSLENLAENCTLYKIILSCTNNKFPYVNIMDDKQRLENNYSASFDMAESRALAIKHLKSICLHAKKVVLYDKYFSSKQANGTINSRNVDLMKNILPPKKLDIKYNDISQQDITLMEQYCKLWKFTKDPQIANRHDRYLIIDDKLEVILTSGFDHLNDDSRDLTYIIRSVDKSRFSAPSA